MTDDIKNLHLFDSNCMLGRMIAPKPGFPESARQLLAVMDSFGIAEALVYHTQSKQYDPIHGNESLMEEIEGLSRPHAARLHAAWVLLPSHTGEFPDEFPDEDSLLRQMLARNVKAARLFPAADNHNYSLKPYCAEKLLHALENAKMPLFIDQNQIGWDDVHDLCRDYPGLPLVLSAVGYRVDRFLYPLLERFGNLHVELSHYYGHRGIEALVERFGAGRFLFGTNLPYYSPAAAIAILAYARLEPSDRQLIAAGNLSTLLNRKTVKHEHPGPRPLGTAHRRHACHRLPRTSG